MPPSRSQLNALASDVRCLARRHGPRAAARILGAAVLDSAFPRHDLHVLVKPLDAIGQISFEQRLRVGEVGPESLVALAEFNRARCDTRASHRFAANLERRYHGFTAHEDGRLVGHYWWLDDTAEPHPHLQRLGIALGPQDVYGFDFFLDERHRGEGRAVGFLFEVESRLRERGYERLWGYVEGANTAARWLYSMRGYETVRTLRGRRGAMR
jgi:GNAT superfamily N-acetyltransferase